MDKNEVLNKIVEAFSGVVLGNGIGLWEAQAIDDYESKKEQRKVRENDEKENWKLIPPDILQRCHSSLSFFNADGMRFYLSAFIIGSLENEVDDPIFHLTQLDNYAKAKLTTLNDAQRQAIIMYLKWCLEQDEYDFDFDHPVIRRALNEYWEKKSNKKSIATAK